MSGRNRYTSDEERLLVKYIARYNPAEPGRLGNALYKRLCENVDGKWNWHTSHSWSSWRDHYVKRKDAFDVEIKKYMEKHNIKPEKTKASISSRKRVRGDEVDTSLSENDAGAEGRMRGRKRKKVESSSNTKKRAKTKQERVDGIADNSGTGKSCAEKTSPPQPRSNASRAQTLLHGRARFKMTSHDDEEEEEEEEEGARDVRGNADDHAKEANDEASEVEDEVTSELEADGDDEEDESGDEQAQESEPAGPDDYHAEIFQDDIVEIAKNDTESSTENDDSDPDGQIDELLSDTPDKDRQPPSQGALLSVYPDITTIPSPYIETANIQPTTELHVPGGFSEPELPQDSILSSKPLPSSSHGLLPKAAAHREPLHRHEECQPEASSSRVQLSPSHKVSRSSPLFAGARPKRRPAKDEDFFASLPTTPTPRSLSPKDKRKLPKFVEGPYRTFFAETPKSVIDSSDSSGEGTKNVWPPPRKRKIALDNTRAEETTTIKHGNKASTKGKGRMIDEHPKPPPKTKVEHTVSQPLVHPKHHTSHPAVHSEKPNQRFRLPLKPSDSRQEHHPFTQPSQPLSTGEQVPKPRTPSNPNPTKRLGDERSRSKNIDGSLGESPNAMAPAQKDQAIPKRTKPHTKALDRGRESFHSHAQQPNADSAKDMQILPPAPQSGSAVLEGQAKRHGSSLRHEAKFTEFTPPRDSWTPGNPFVAPPVTHSDHPGKGKGRAPNLFDRRHTIDGSVDIHSSSHVDLRAQSSHRLPTRQSLPPPLDPASIARSVSASGIKGPSLLPIPVADEDQYKVDYLGMSAAVSLIAKNFSLAEDVVWRAWEKTKSISVTEEFCRRLSNVNAQAELAVLRDMQHDGSLVADSPAPRHSQYSASAPSSRSPSKNQDFKVRPLLEDDAMSEYVPPPSTRAGQYARLVREGRKEEALNRESLRASGSGSKSFPKRLQEVVGQPTGRSEDGIRSSAAPTSPSPITSAQNEGDGLGPSQPLKMEEDIENAFLSATIHNADELREIERKIDPDFMLHWVASRLVQLRERINMDSEQSKPD